MRCTCGLKYTEESLIAAVVFLHPDVNAISIDKFRNEFNELLRLLTVKKRILFCWKLHC